MGDDAQDEFVLLRAGLACGQGLTEAALVLTEGAFDVPALTVKLGREALVQRAAIGCLRRTVAGVARAEGDDALVQAQFLLAETVVVFGIVARVGSAVWKRTRAAA